IGDGEDEMAVNPDGSINTVVVPSLTNALVNTLYGEATAVPAATPTVVCTLTVPPTGSTFLTQIDASGDNIGLYTVLLNGQTLDVKRTYFGGALNCTFNFSTAGTGLLLAAGDVLEVVAEHNRPNVGDFNA